MVNGSAAAAAPMKLMDSDSDGEAEPALSLKVNDAYAKRFQASNGDGMCAMRA